VLPANSTTIRNRVYDAHGAFLGAICSTHGEYVPADDLVRSKREPTGFLRICKPCRAAASRDNLPALRARLRERTDAEVLADWDRLRGPGGPKRCRLCGREKPMQSFAAHRAMPDGRAAECRTCFGDYQKARRK